MHIAQELLLACPFEKKPKLPGVVLVCIPRISKVLLGVMPFPAPLHHIELLAICISCSRITPCNGCFYQPPLSRAMLKPRVGPPTRGRAALWLNHTKNPTCSIPNDCYQPFRSLLSWQSATDNTLLDPSQHLSRLTLCKH
jgi:hypothetical protein